MKLDLNWIKNVHVNLSAVERRTSTLIKRRSVKKEYQVAWLLKAITLIDLTTLSGDDTIGKVEKLCIKGLNPISDSIIKNSHFSNSYLYYSDFTNSNISGLDFSSITPFIT